MKTQFYITDRIKQKIKYYFLVFAGIFFSIFLYAQPCTISPPVLFGNPVDKIVCRGSDAQFGVNGSEQTQQYFFYVTNGATRKIGGPLVGNGDQLSVDANVASASATGQYFVETKQGTCTATNPGFYVYYGNIDDLSITAWGGNSVSFQWASSGRSPYVKYEYAVTTESDPYSISDADTATTYNTSATVTGLTPATTYYIHVRVFEVYKQPYGGSDGAQVDDQCFSGIPWSTIYFTSCSGSPAIGGIAVANPFFCTGNTTTLLATGGLTYQWYKDGSIINTLGTNSDYLAGAEGNYSVYITSNAGCEGMTYSKYIIERKTVTGVFSGGGNYCLGDDVSLGISKTNVNQVYEIRNNGQLVTTLQGIGRGFQSEDTVWYNFVINSPSQSGTYTVTTINEPCQGISFGSVNINLLATGNIDPSSASICSGGSVLLTANGGTSYDWFKDGTPVSGSTATYIANSPGEYSVIIHDGTCSNPASNTCMVTATPPLTSTTNVAICTNQLPYTWNGNSYTAAGTYNVTLIGTAGCDSIATLNLSVSSTLTSTTNVAICTNQLPYTWNGNSYTAAGTYNITLIGTAGCDSIATLNLSVNPTLTSTTNIAICTNQLPYTWNGNSYNAAGTYNITLIGTAGCDSIATLNLSVNPTLTSTTNVAICVNQLPYVWNGNSYSAAGTYNITLIGTAGCDSIATLNLLVNPTLTSTTNVAICTNQLPYTWNGNNYTGAGTYNVTLIGTAGCDSIATLNLSVNPTLTSTTNVAICTNQLPYTWNGNNYTAAGTYNVTLIGTAGCDSIATLNLSVNPTLTSTTNVAICTNQLPYTWNGNSYTAAGTYNITLIGTAGCDSIATLNLSVNPTLTSTTNVAICVNQLPYVWNGNSYSAAGTYNITLIGTAGCDSIATLILSVNPTLTSTTNVAICTNQLPYTWNGNNYTAAGTYNVTLIGTAGCDSIATLNLSVNPTLTSTTNVAICTNQLPYTWNGNSYTAAGTYNITLIGTAGCDSIATLNLSVNPTLTSTTNIAICTNQLPYTWNGNSYNAAGTYNITLIGTAGCDSIATLILSVNPTLTSTTNVAICVNQLPYVWNGNRYSAAGTYNVTLIGTAGCDSIATLNLLVNPTLTSTTNVAICVNQLPYVWNGNNYSVAGTYNVTLIGTAGCDSIATLNLSVNPILTSTTNISVCNNQLPYVWNGNNYTTAGTYTVTLTTTAGCDSIATLNLSVNPVLTSTTNVSVCSNQLPYRWNGNNYSNSGAFSVTLLGSNGCDSIATLNLIVKLVSTSQTSAAVCANELPYNWNGNSYNSAGSYNVLFTGANGCDSIATLVLTVNTVPIGSISPANAFICPGTTQILTVSGGASYQWLLNGTAIPGANLSTYNASLPGTYTARIIGNNGCESMASNNSILTLFAKPIAAFSWGALCQQELTAFNNLSQTAGVGTVNWTWDFGDGTNSSLFAPSHIYNSSGTFTVTLIATSASCSQIADTIKKVLTINAAVPGIRYPSINVLKNNATSLTARNIGLQYLWQPITGLNNPSIQNPLVTTATDKEYTISITNNVGCHIVDTLFIRVFDKSEIFVPKAFTPNRNNANDVLRPLLVGFASIEYFRVYNRWGQLVYQTQSIGEGWDGNFKNAAQPMETYNWVFAGKSIDGSVIKANGKTVLIR